MARPKEADPAQTYDAIVARASELLGELEDPSALKLRDVALGAGVSLGTIHYYFASKNELLEACLDGYYARLSALAADFMARAAEPDGSSARAFVREAGREFYRFARRERGPVRLRLSLNASLGELHPRRQAPYLRVVISAAAEVLARRIGSPSASMPLAIQSLAYLIVRLALMSDSELHALVGSDAAEGRGAVERFVEDAAWRLLAPAGDAD